MDNPAQIQLWGGGKVNLWLGRSHHRQTSGPVDFISGASLLLSCDALAEVGLFDESRFFMYWEDTDLGFRLRRAGWELAVAENSTIWHRQFASLGRRNPLLSQYFVTSAIRFLRVHSPVPGASIFFMLCLMLGKRLLQGDLRQVAALVRGVYRA